MGGRFRKLDQTHSKLHFGPEIFVQDFLRNRLKKGLHRNLKGFCPQTLLKTKKKGLHDNLALSSAGL